MIPETRYARTADGVRIAYQVLGLGPVDLVLVKGFVAHLEVDWEEPRVGRFFRRLAEFSRLILFDQRGTGLSDRSLPVPEMESRAADLRAVLDAAHSERAVLCGEGVGGSLGAFFVATYPERVIALAWYAAAARSAWAPDFPTGHTQEEQVAWQAALDEGWGTEEYAKASLEEGAPGMAADADWVRWYAKRFRYGASPGEALAFDNVWYATDVRAVLPSVRVPTLVVAREGFDADLSESRQVAEWIPGARLVVLPGRDRPWISDVQDRFLQELRAFVAEVRDQEAELDRVLATVLFTDIVNSTGQAAVIGDRRWQTIRAEHDRIVRASVARYRGKALKTLGDGFLATFDGPARGVHCARAISLAVRSLGIEVRAGLHTGEVELDGDDIAGIAVVIGARVAALAAPSEVLVSRTVKDLVAGSGLAFEDRGAYPLKGVPDEWHLYAVASGQA